jgi:Zn-dependent protease with chaperone function
MPDDRLTARYTDGVTAAERTVEVRISADGLAFDGGGRRHAWPAEGLEMIDRAGDQVRLGHRGHGEARLVFEGAAARERLDGVLPGLTRRSRDSLRMDLRNFAKIGGAVVVAAALIVISLPALTGLITTLIPLSVERELGEDTLETLGAIFKGADRRCDEPAGQAALAALTERLTSGGPLRVPVDVRVVPVDVVNALALPGGTVLIFDGLLQKAGNPEEVAGVIAHEIGHTQFRHGMQRFVQAYALSALLSIVAPSDIGALAGAFAELLIQQSYSRDAEREADAYAVDTLNRIGVSAEGMAGFFDRLSDREPDGGGAFAYLSSHPLSVERAETIREGATGDGRILDDDAWADLRSICARAE